MDTDLWRLMLVFRCKEPSCGKLHTRTIDVSAEDAQDIDTGAMVVQGICEQEKIPLDRVVALHTIPPNEPVCGLFRALAEGHMMPPLTTLHLGGGS